MIAVIPSIGASPLLTDLLNSLNAEGVKTIVVDNYRDRTTAMNNYVITDNSRYLWRPGWSIYRTWNFGIRYGALRNENVLVLNDDISVYRNGIRLIDDALSTGEWAMVGFDYEADFKQGAENKGIREVHGTKRHHGIGCFAFGVNPRKCGRVYDGYYWWGGDDDLVYHTRSLGGKVGVMTGNPVLHEESTSARSHGDLLPPDWFEHDRQLLKIRWGETW